MHTNSTVTKIVRSPSKAPKRAYAASKQNPSKQQPVAFKRSLQNGYTIMQFSILWSILMFVVVAGSIYFKGN